MGSSSLIIPGQGRVMIDKDVQLISKRSIQVLSMMHQVSEEVKGIEVRCLKCGSSFVGRNNDDPGTATFSVYCNCRELRYIRGA